MQVNNRVRNVALMFVKCSETPAGKLLYSEILKYTVPYNLAGSRQVTCEAFCSSPASSFL